jgi:hypothetical protein
VSVTSGRRLTGASVRAQAFLAARPCVAFLHRLDVVPSFTPQLNRSSTFFSRLQSTLFARNLPTCSRNHGVPLALTQPSLSVPTHPHVLFAMRFFSPAQALAALTLSLSAVRLHVGALQLDPVSPGTWPALHTQSFAVANSLHRLNQRCLLQDCETARRAICRQKRQRLYHSRRLSWHSLPAILLVAGRCYVRHIAGLLALHGRRPIQRLGARRPHPPVWGRP